MRNSRRGPCGFVALPPSCSGLRPSDDPANHAAAGRIVSFDAAGGRRIEEEAIAGGRLLGSLFAGKASMKKLCAGRRSPTLIRR